MKNLAFWMELNTPMKILAFCISSFQSSWHFAFCIPWGTKHNQCLWYNYDINTSISHYYLALAYNGPMALHQKKKNATFIGCKPHSTRIR
jgi:hypothetical protein